MYAVNTLFYLCNQWFSGSACLWTLKYEGPKKIAARLERTRLRGPVMLPAVREHWCGFAPVTLCGFAQRTL